MAEPADAVAEERRARRQQRPAPGIAAVEGPRLLRPVSGLLNMRGSPVFRSYAFGSASTMSPMMIGRFQKFRRPPHRNLPSAAAKGVQAVTGELAAVVFLERVAVLRATRPAPARRPCTCTSPRCHCRGPYRRWSGRSRREACPTSSRRSSRQGTTSRRMSRVSGARPCGPTSGGPAREVSFTAVASACWRWASVMFGARKNSVPSPRQMPESSMPLPSYCHLRPRWPGQGRRRRRWCSSRGCGHRTRCGCHRAARRRWRSNPSPNSLPPPPAAACTS